MKRVTASEARRNWFRLLDEVLAGESVVVIRNGQRILIRREEPARAARRKTPDYGALIKVRDVDALDAWSWEWTGPEGDLTPRQKARDE